MCIVCAKLIVFHGTLRLELEQWKKTFEEILGSFIQGSPCHSGWCRELC